MELETRPAPWSDSAVFAATLRGIAAAIELADPNEPVSLKIAAKLLLDARNTFAFVLSSLDGEWGSAEHPCWSFKLSPQIYTPDIDEYLWRNRS